MALILNQIERAAFFLFLAVVLLGNVATIIRMLLYRS